MVDAILGEIVTTCEKIHWLIREGEKWLKPERRSAGLMVGSNIVDGEPRTGIGANALYGFWGH